MEESEIWRTGKGGKGGMEEGREGGAEGKEVGKDGGKKKVYVWNSLHDLTTALKNGREGGKEGGREEEGRRGEETGKKEKKCG